MGNSKGIVIILRIGTIDAAKYSNEYEFNDYRNHQKGSRVYMKREALINREDII